MSMGWLSGKSYVKKDGDKKERVTEMKGFSGGFLWASRETRDETGKKKEEFWSKKREPRGWF